MHYKFHDEEHNLDELCNPQYLSDYDYLCGSANCRSDCGYKCSLTQLGYVRVCGYVGASSGDNNSEPGVYRKKPQTLLMAAFEWLDSIISAFIVTVVFFSFVFMSGIKGASMLPTLHDGDHLLVSHFMYQPKRGDVVIIKAPGALKENIVKRVIAIDGDTISFESRTGDIVVNDTTLDEPYINQVTREWASWQIPEVIPEGHVFVMGDNRNVSKDSRSSEVKLINKKSIMGKAEFVVFPFNRIGSPYWG